jgi:hypothetical protein
MRGAAFKEKFPDKSLFPLGNPKLHPVVEGTGRLAPINTPKAARDNSQGGRVVTLTLHRMALFANLMLGWARILS